MNELTCHLPAIPDDAPLLSRTRGILRIATALGTPIPREVYAVLAWGRTVAAACQDRYLYQGPFVICLPETAPKTEGLPDRIRSSELSPESQLVFRRLWFLIEELNHKLPSFKESVVVEDLADVIGRYSEHLLWDAALDLLLAEQLRESTSYTRYAPHPIIKDAFSWMDAPEASELRIRVLYLVEVLTFIYEVTLREQIFIRLSSRSAPVVRMQEAADWFRTYAAMYHPEQPPQTLLRKLMRWLEG